MKIAVTDANIFIDLIKLQLLGFLFSIEIEIYTSQEIIDQLNDSQQEKVNGFIQARALNIYIFSEEEIEKIDQLNAPRSLDFADKTVVYLANKIGATVLSGDGPLRKYSINSKLTVKGIIWLFDSFLDKQLITNQSAVEKMKELLSFNDRLPKEECLSRIKQWESIII
jgi:predicted nucleic acid-binding protein